MKLIIIQNYVRGLQSSLKVVGLISMLSLTCSFNSQAALLALPDLVLPFAETDFDVTGDTTFNFKTSRGLSASGDNINSGNISLIRSGGNNDRVSTSFLQDGDVMDSTVSVTHNYLLLASFDSTPSSGEGIVGLVIDTGPTTSYGYYQFDYQTNGTISGTTISFSNGFYESTPNTAITVNVSAVPEPSSMGLLALSALGVLSRRRR